MSEPPAGLVHVPDFATADEEQQLIGVLSALDYEEVRMHGVVARRTVRHFGYDYAYESRRIEPTDPIPSELDWVRPRAAELAGIDADSLVELLVTRYPPGAGIGWHRDAPMFGSKVIGISLAGTCRLRFRRPTPAGTAERFVLDLVPRSAYVIGDSARWNWQHQIPPTKELRWSLTFRSLRSRV